MKQLLMSIACLIGSPLLAEVVGNLQFQFPPSQHEWRLLADTEQFPEFTFEDSDSDSEFGDLVYEVDSDEEDDDFQCKLYTHREGDALEMFIALSGTDDDSDEESGPESINDFELIKKQFGEHLSKIFPNHSISILSHEGTTDNGFAEWEFNDGVQDLMHGFTRMIFCNGQRAILSYSTTAVKSEYNRHLWTDVLNQASIVE